MATLEIGFNCMHLFAPEPSMGTMHVLMPSTKGPGHAHSGPHSEGGAAPPHVVRIFHPSLPEKGAPMEGWELVLGRRDGASKGEASSRTRDGDGELADLTSVSGLVVSRELIEHKVHQSVVSRVTLLAGFMKRLAYEVKWEFACERRPLAYEATWRIVGLSAEDVTWNRLAGRGDPPVPSLTDLEPDSDGVIRIKIYHVPESALPPAGSGTLDEAEIRRHFRAFYRMLGVVRVPALWLPSSLGRVDKLNCVGVTASIEGEETDALFS